MRDKAAEVLEQADVSSHKSVISDVRPRVHVFLCFSEAFDLHFFVAATIYNGID